LLEARNGVEPKNKGFAGQGLVEAHANLKMVMKYCHTRESHTAAAMKKYIGSFGQPVEAQPQATGSVS